MRFSVSADTLSYLSNVRVWLLLIINAVDVIIRLDKTHRNRLFDFRGGSQVEALLDDRSIARRTFY